ncbi:MAG: M14 family zinc carboxypeptidase [Sarcina sp.]
MHKRIKVFITVIITVIAIIGVICLAVQQNRKIKKSMLTKETKTIEKVEPEKEAKPVIVTQEKKQEKKVENKQEKKQQVSEKDTYINSELPVVSENTKVNSNNKIMEVKNNTEVYANADKSSKKIGSVEASERVIYKENDAKFTKIAYSSSSGMKEGYVNTNDLKVAPIIPNDFNNLIVPSNVTKVQYGTSGLGRPLYYYKIGNGKKQLLMDFAIHGYEDSWVQDGYVLTQIAEYLIKNLSKQDITNKGLEGWSVYIIPSSNPDGLLDGYTNNGPGRTEVEKKIDINRDFSGPGFEVESNSRNKTGKEPFSAPETKALANLIDKLSSKGQLIVTDTHGWLDFTKGNASVAKYFDQEFNLKNQVIHKYFGGYLVGYAKMKGARELLIELPDPSSPQNAIKEQYNEKMLKAVDNLINNYKF